MAAELSFHLLIKTSIALNQLSKIVDALNIKGKIKNGLDFLKELPFCLYALCFLFHIHFLPKLCKELLDTAIYQFRVVEQMGLRLTKFSLGR